MGKPTGFIETDRLLPARRAVAERLADWREVERSHGDDHARAQAGRCMDCGVPFCMQGCPLGNRIPEFNDALYRGDEHEAYRHLAATNNFPELTGRLCPAPCEAACTLAINREAVTIEHIEKHISERAFEEGWVVPTVLPPTGKRVAIVGSGPAGLAAAAQLCSAGHVVTVFERDDRIGGLCRYGIPDFKLEKAVLDRRLALLEAAGIQFRPGTDVGNEVRWDTLRDDHDALLIAIGARIPRELDVPGRSLEGVMLAMDYLEAQHRGHALARDKRVIILGGGDTGSDCLGTALRQGARSVQQIELMPMPPRQRADDNPWPEWPRIFRTSSSQEEGGDRGFGLLTKRLVGEGKVAALEAVTVKLEERRVVEVPNSTQRLEVDLLILAMGFVGADMRTLNTQLGVTFEARSCATNLPGVFAAGDARRGQSLIVWAIAEGREAAHQVDAYLRGGMSVLPRPNVFS